MKEAFRKFKNDSFNVRVALFTRRFIVVVICGTVIIATFLIIGTVIGELVYVVIPHRQ